MYRCEEGGWEEEMRGEKEEISKILLYINISDDFCSFLFPVS